MSDDDPEYRTFDDWTVETADSRDKFDYVVQSGRGDGLIWCTERQLRALRDAIDAKLDDGDTDASED